MITQGVTPSLHTSYKSPQIKQYFKEDHALRTETTINNTRDFALGRRLHNLPALRAHVAQLMGESPERYTPARMTYDLCRLRLHGLLQRIPGTHRYAITALGKRVSPFFTKLNARVIRLSLSQLFDGCPKAPNRPIANAMQQLNYAFEELIAEAKLGAQKMTHLQRSCGLKNPRGVN